jgi:lipopolysaccharide biosynthesis glycosyltransferase
MCTSGIEIIVRTKYLSCSLNWTPDIEMTAKTTETARTDHGTYQSGCMEINTETWQLCNGSCIEHKHSKLLMDNAYSKKGIP